MFRSQPTPHIVHGLSTSVYRWFCFVVCPCLVVIVGWLCYEYGYHNGTKQLIPFHNQKNTLKLELLKCQKKTSLFNKQTAICERSQQLHYNSRNEIRLQAEKMQTELLNLRKELAFYRGIVTPSEANLGLNIQDFKTTALAEIGNYRYDIMVTQAQKKFKIVQGVIDITIDGLDNGVRTTLTRKQFDANTEPTLPFKFKYFQKFSGVMRLPKQFNPENITVTLIPEIGKKTVRRRFLWSESRSF